MSIKISVQYKWNSQISFMRRSEILFSSPTADNKRQDKETQIITFVFTLFNQVSVFITAGYCLVSRRWEYFLLLCVGWWYNFTVHSGQNVFWHAPITSQCTFWSSHVHSVNAVNKFTGWLQDGSLNFAISYIMEILWKYLWFTIGIFTNCSAIWKAIIKFEIMPNAYMWIWSKTFQ